MSIARGARARRGAVVIAGAAAAALALGGCAAATDASTTADVSAEQGQQVGTEVIAEAFRAAIATGSAQLTGSVQTNAGGQDATFTFSGPQSFAPGGMDITVTSEAFGSQSLRQVLVDGVLYVQIPELNGKWLQLPVADFAASANPYLVPEQSLDDLIDLQQVGSGSFNGQDVTYYQATLEVGSALAKLNLPPQVLAGAQEKLAADPGSTSVRLAVDSAGRLVQWQSDSTLQLADGTSVSASADLSWSAFGEPVAIAAPPADEVIDIGSVAGLLPPGLLPGTTPQG